MITFKNNGIKIKISTLRTQSQSGIFGNSKSESYYVEITNRYTKKSTIIKTRDFSFNGLSNPEKEDLILSNVILEIYDKYKEDKELQKVVSKEWVESMYVMAKLTI